MVRGVVLAIAALGAGGALAGKEEAAVTLSPDDTQKLGFLLAGATADGGGGGSAGAFDGNPLAGGCTATANEFVARYGQKQGFKNYINTQIGLFKGCLDGKFCAWCMHAPLLHAETLLRLPPLPTATTSLPSPSSFWSPFPQPTHSTNAIPTLIPRGARR
jgi:hypothetical protein